MALATKRQNATLPLANIDATLALANNSSYCQLNKISSTRLQIYTCSTFTAAIELHEINPATVTSGTPTPVATFTIPAGSQSALIVFKENGANSLLFHSSGNATDTITIFRFNSSTVSGTVAATATITGMGTIRGLQVHLNGANSYLFSTDNANNRVDMLEFSATGITSANTRASLLRATFAGTGGTTICSYHQLSATVGYLAALSFAAVRFWRFDPSTISTTGTVHTASFSFNTGNPLGGMGMAVDGADSYIAAMMLDISDNQNKFVFRTFNPATVLGTVSYAPSAIVRSGTQNSSYTNFGITRISSTRHVLIASIVLPSIVGGLILNPQSFGTLNEFLSFEYSSTGTVNHALLDEAGDLSTVVAVNRAGVPAISIWKGALTRIFDNRTTISALTFGDSSPIRKTGSGPIVLGNSSIEDFLFFRYLISGKSVLSTGTTTTTFNYQVTISEDTVVTFDGEDFEMSGASSAITGNYRINIASGRFCRLSSKGTYADSITVKSGAELKITANTILTSEFVLESGATVTGSGFTLTIPYPDPGLILGGGVVLSAPIISYTATGLVNNTQLYLAHQQSFVVASAAVNTGPDTITLGNDSNSRPPAFATGSPYTNVKIQATAGATLPTTSPQIVDGGRYYATVSSGAITLFVKEADIPATPITISTAGTNASGSIFTLITETQKHNAVVSGGSGASVVLTLASGDRVVRKAIYWASSAGVATATPLYVQEFLWSSAAGINDPVVVNPAIELNSVHEDIVASTSVQLGGRIKNASGAVVTELTAANDGSTLDASNGGPYSFGLEGGGGRLQVNASDADGLSLWQDIYIWGVWVSSTAPGIRLVNADTSVAITANNFVFANFEIDNTSSTRLNVIGGNATSVDGSSLVAPIQTGIGGINPNALSLGTLLTFESGTSGLTVGEAATLAAIEDYTRPMAKQLGLVPGVDAVHTLGSSIVVSDGDGSTTITTVGVDSYKVELT